MRTMMLIGILTGISLFSACKKDKSNATSSSTFTAQIDGETYTATSASVISNAPDPDVNDHLILTINAADKNMHVLAVGITFPEDKPHTGSFKVNTDNTIMYGNAGTTYSSDFGDQATGEIVISKMNDHSVQGTFNGIVFNANDLSDKKTISNGRFDIKY